jgi:hypothetical protein
VVDWDAKMAALRSITEHNRKVDEQRRDSAQWKLLAVAAGVVVGVLRVLFGPPKGK